MPRLLRNFPGRDFARRVQPYFPPLNFITIHYLYFVGTCLFTSIIFYVSSTPAWSISYLDSLFLVISAMTEAGLNTVNLSVMNTFQQWMLWMHIMAGSAVFVSIWVIHIRKRAFEKRFGALLRSQSKQIRERRKSFSGSRGHLKTRSQNTESGNDHTIDHHLDPLRSPGNRETVDTAHERSSGFEGARELHTLRASESTQVNEDQDRDMSPQYTSSDHISFVPAVHHSSSEHVSHRRRPSQVFSFTGVGASPISTSFRRPGQESVYARSVMLDYVHGAKIQSSDNISLFLSKDVVGRNSQFHGLTREERELLGGVEYRAITLLSWLVPIYFILFQLFGCLGMGLWMKYHAGEITRENGINPWYAD
jgi:hypothetical protein